MPDLDLFAILVILAALAGGGILKGAIGMGAPVVAVPVMASFFDVRLAVVIMVLPNLCTNAWQLWGFRRSLSGPLLTGLFAGAGVVGAGLGTVLLANLSPILLSRLVALAVIGYIALRLVRPDFTLTLRAGLRLAVPAGLVAGILQGAAGISAPASVSFLNAMRLPRDVFIPMISVFFIGMTLAQIPALLWYGMLDGPLALAGLAALVPLVIFMPVGQWLARSISARLFDRIVLVALAILAVKLLLGV